MMRLWVFRAEWTLGSTQSRGTLFHVPGVRGVSKLAGH